MLLGAGALALTACKQGPRPLFCADMHPPDYPTVKGVQAMAKLLEARSGGEMSIRVYPSGQLGTESASLQITIFGGLDLCRVNIAPLNPIAPETQVLSLPFLFDSVSHARRVFDGAPGRTILDALEPHGLIGLCYYDSGARCFYNTKRPIHTPEDLKGLKVRVQSSDLYVAMVAAAGGSPTPMPPTEVYQALVQGVVDGAENNWPSYESGRHFEVAPYYSLSNHVMAPEVLVMSRRRWEKLGDDQRELVMACARDSVPIMRGLWDERERAAREHVLSKGVEVNDVQRDLFARRMLPVWQRFVESPAMERLVEDVRNLGDAHA